MTPAAASRRAISPRDSSRPGPRRSGNTYRGSTSPWRGPSPAPVKTPPSAFRRDQAEVPVAAPVDNGDPLVGRVPEHKELLAGSVQPQARLLDAHRLFSGGAGGGRPRPPSAPARRARA